MAPVAGYRVGARAWLIVACATLVFCAISGADDQVRLRARDAAGFAGGQVVVDIAMDASPWPSALNFWIEYDTTKLTFVDAKPGAVVTLAGKDVSWDFPAPGRVSFVIFGLNDTPISPGKILSITFAIDDGALPGDEFDIDGLNVSATDPDANPIPAEFEDGEINVLQCFQPAAPTGFTATNGAFGDHVQLSWSPVFGAQSYVVYRSTQDDPGTASILAVTVLPFYSDFSALGASYTSTGGGGCGGSTGQSLRYTEYYYWVQAQNICGESDLAAESGWRGKADTSLKSAARIDALPTAPDDTTAQVALWLTADDAIDVESVNAIIEGGPADAASVMWQPLDDSGTTGWVVVTLASPLGECGPVTVRAEAMTVAGQHIGPVIHTFASMGAIDFSASPPSAKSGESTVVTQIDAPAVPDFIESVGPRYSIYPVVAFDGPKHILVPVPDGVEAADVLPYVFVARQGWYPAQSVPGWIVPGSIVPTELDGVPCVAFDANFGGIVQLGYPPSSPPSNWAGGIPTGIAALALLLSSIGHHRGRGSA